MRTAAILAFLLLTAAAPSPDTSPISDSQQLILVIAPDWNAKAATMTRYELRGSSWEAVAAPAQVILGRSGMAWARAVNRDIGSGPVKREGDGKSPAGVFRLGTAFGFSASPSWVRLPWLQLRDTTECVDDAASSHYNAIVDRDSVRPVDWSSSERMRAIDVYRFGVVVLHNEPPQPHGGSCIFLHLVDPKGNPTSGCTSMSAEAMEALLRWVDPSRRPLLVQLPRSEYDRLRGLWHLP
jgi:zinc D-Ala-D-Ala dipeptidase